MAERPRGGHPDDFPWASFFQRSSDPLFLLNCHARILFVNRAWEELTGLSLAQARGLRCRRPRHPSLGTPWRETLAHLLSPPIDALEGRSSLVRRQVPPRENNPGGWWDVDFLPLANGPEVMGLLGRIRVPALVPWAAPFVLPEALATLRARHVARFRFEEFDSRSPALRRAVEQARLAARLEAPLLLVGPPGCGKETLARVIHLHSPRTERPFVALDCRRLPAFAVGMALFRPGPGFRAGTVYLAEPERLPRDLQARVTDLLDVAENENPSESPRLLAGLTTEPSELVRQGLLVEELYERLNLLRIDLPSLASRRDDLPRLINRLLDRLNQAEGQPVTGLTPDAWEVVLAYTWPGNLTELLGVLQAARHHAQGDLIDGKDIPFPIRQAVQLQNVPPTRPPRLLELDKILEQVERRLIELALARAKGNHTRAAEYLSIWRARLLRRVKALQLGEPPVAELDEEES